MGNQWSLMLLILLCGFLIICRANSRVESDAAKSRVIKVNGGSTEESSVVWVVQLSDLHFSVHHPDRSLDFSRLVGPALSLINPSLVLITGDLTDGKSWDLLTMKQNEKEWVEYQTAMVEVVQRSGLDKSIFYDLRGNHDNFGVPSIGDWLDFFSKFSVSGQMGRNSTVNSVTVETHSRKHLFVGLDSTMPVGVRGPTNLFGHPTDELLRELDSQLSQWDNSSPAKPVTKLSFGHFPLSFSAPTSSGNSLRDIFLKHSVSAYLCGHLHTRFGKNLKRLHQSVHHHPHGFFQLNIKPPFSAANCSYGAPHAKEFWEWEMGDWRKSRAMRILAIDNGHVSYIDIDFIKGPKNTIIVPTFPLDSRFMSTSCPNTLPSIYETVRALIFSTSTIVSVVARVFDTRGVDFRLVEELHMTKQLGHSIYSAPWNYKAFEDPSPDRFWLQIEATDVTGRITFTELRPFSVNGLSARVIWTWKEFFVMGCQWAVLYGPMLWCAVFLAFSILAIPKVLSMYLNKQLRYTTWVLQGLCEISIVWFGFWGYLLYLLLFPWFVGKVFTDGGRGYMTYKGWVVNTIKSRSTAEFVGYPDIMVIVLPHLVFVVLPSVLVASALAAENKHYQDHVQSTLRKKEDDYHGGVGNCRRMRKLLMVVCLIICWKHFKNCRDLVKAYEMNPIFHSPVYCFWIPLLLGYAVYATATNTKDNKVKERWKN